MTAALPAGVKRAADSSQPTVFEAPAARGNGPHSLIARAVGSIVALDHVELATEDDRDLVGGRGSQAQAEIEPGFLDVLRSDSGELARIDARVGKELEARMAHGRSQHGVDPEALHVET